MFLVGNRGETRVRVKRRRRKRDGTVAEPPTSSCSRTGTSGGGGEVFLVGFYQHYHAIFPDCFVFALHFINTTGRSCCPFLWVY
jgi:hypothetical protein